MRPELVENFEQGSPEWFAARVGTPSASCFDRLVTATMKPSSQKHDYMYELLSEFIIGEKKPVAVSPAMARGTAMEPQARRMYELLTGNTVHEVGFCWRDDKRQIGCSPDGLVITDPRAIYPVGHPFAAENYSRGLEIKCPLDHTHVQYLLQGVLPKAYVAQVQGSMWVTGLHRWDFFSYHDKYEPLLITVDRDDEWMAAFDKIVPPFLEDLAALKASDDVQQMKEVS